MLSDSAFSMKEKIVVRYGWDEDEDFSAQLATGKTVRSGTLTLAWSELPCDKNYMILVGLE